MLHTRTRTIVTYTFTDDDAPMVEPKITSKPLRAHTIEVDMKWGGQANRDPLIDALVVGNRLNAHGEPVRTNTTDRAKITGIAQPHRRQIIEHFNAVLAAQGAPLLDPGTGEPI